MRNLKREGGWALHATSAALVFLATAVVSGCGSAAEETAGQRVGETAGPAAQLQTTCAKDAKPVGLPFNFPVSAKLPQGYIVTVAGDRQSRFLIHPQVLPVETTANTRRGRTVPVEGSFEGHLDVPTGVS